MSEGHVECDVCVVGGGPAGATAATFIAMQGHRVLLLERETLPVYKIGESLLPATVHGICAMLGVADEVKNAGFVRKHGGTFIWGSSPEPWTFSFAESSAFPGPTSYAYQVERLRFDAILLNNARRKGVDVRERHRVTSLVVENDRVVGLEGLDPGGRQLSVRCRYVVDASGHGSSIAHHAGERVYSEFFRNIAVFGYFLNGKRLPAPRSGNIFSVAFRRGWFWYIPLSDVLTSVGAVIGREHADVLRQDRDAALQELIAECQPVLDLLVNATRVTDGTYGEVRVRKDYSYLHTQFWRPGFVLVGDAACFIDPVFSSGVHLATYSALLAARSVNTCLAGALSEARAFTEFEARYRREYQYFHDFLTAFYDTNQDLDSYFWTARKVVRTDGAARDAFVRLVGGAAGSGEMLFGAADGFQKARVDLETRIAAARTGTANRAGEAVAPLQPSDFWVALNAESVAIQVRGALSGAPVAETSLFPDGLVASADGLRWAEPLPRQRQRTAAPVA